MKDSLKVRVKALRKRRTSIFDINGEPYVFLKSLEEGRALLRHALDGSRQVAHPISDLVAYKGKPVPDSPSDEHHLLDTSEYTDAEIAEANRRFDLIRPLLESDRTVSRTDVAKRAGVSPQTITAWTNLMRETGSVLMLLPKPRGWRKGRSRLASNVDSLIKSVIDLKHLRERKRVSSVVTLIAGDCKTAGLAAPSRATIYARANTIPESEKALLQNRRRDYEGLFQPKKGKFPETHGPFHVVQIDHTVSDVILVESSTRLPVRRAYITLVIDIDTRLVIGWYVSFDPPSYLSVMMALLTAMLPKKELLATYGIPDVLPAHGLIGKVHMDNAREFRGAMLQAAAKLYGIDIEFRPAKRAHYGGHIESLMRTRARYEEEQPGATYGNPKDRDGYDSEGQSALSLADHEKNLIDFLVGQYNYKRHSGLLMSPTAKWRKRIDEVGLPPPVPDRERLMLDFLPFVERTVQRDGIHYDQIYYSDELRPLIGARDPKNRRLAQKFKVRRDPRRPQVVYLWDPRSGRHLTIPSKSQIPEKFTQPDLDRSKRELRRDGAPSPDDQRIIEASEKRVEERTQAAIRTTKSVRSEQARAATRMEKAKDAEVLTGVASAIKPNTGSKTDQSAIDDIFDVDVGLFEDVSEG